MQYRSVHVWPNRLGIQIKAKKKASHEGYEVAIQIVPILLHG